MKAIFYESNTRFTKFYLADILTGELEPCTEQDFTDVVVNFRECFERVYDGSNAQNFIFNGEVVARRERYKKPFLNPKEERIIDDLTYQGFEESQKQKHLEEPEEDGPEL